MGNGRSNNRVYRGHIENRHYTWLLGWVLVPFLGLVSSLGWAEPDQARAEQNVDIVVVGAGTGG